MLVVLQNDQILSTKKVCSQCLWANQKGTPRWREGKLKCGRGLQTKDNKMYHSPVYECQMGFHLVNIK